MSISKIYEQLMDVANIFGGLGEKDHAHAIRQRVKSSPLQSSVNTAVRAATYAASGIAVAAVLAGEGYTYLYPLETIAALGEFSPFASLLASSAEVFSRELQIFATG
jgi:hypothetical protein